MKKVQSRYNAEIGELQDSVDKLQQKLSELKRKRAEETSKFHIGDEVVNKKGQVGKVVGIKVGWGEGVAMIKLYKKNGKIGERITRYYDWDGWELK